MTSNPIPQHWTHKTVEDALEEAHAIERRMPRGTPSRYPHHWATVPRLERTGSRWKHAPRQGGPTASEEEQWINRSHWLWWLSTEDAKILWKIVGGEKQSAVAKRLGRSPKQMTVWKQRSLQIIADHLNNGDTPESAFEREGKYSGALERNSADNTRFLRKFPE
jgi:hypothetical protein